MSGAGSASTGHNLSPALLEDIRQLIAAAPDQDELLPTLRAAYPELRFSQCSEDDIPPRLPPSLSAAGFDLYLMDTREHCIVLTTDAAVASGVVIAWRVEEDEA